jgi:hypothetical protein
MLTDYYAHTYYDDPKTAEETVEDDQFDLNAELALLEAEAEVEKLPDDFEDVT